MCCLDQCNTVCLCVWCVHVCVCVCVCVCVWGGGGGGGGGALVLGMDAVFNQGPVSKVGQFGTNTDSPHKN